MCLSEQEKAARAGIRRKLIGTVDGLGVAAAFEANTAQACELHRHILGVNKELVQLLRRLKSKPLPKMARS